MTAIQVENLLFTFDAGVGPFQCETAGQVVQGWPQGTKVVDIVASDPEAGPQICWLVEAKDYRVLTRPPRPSNLAGLPATMEQKVRDTLAGLQALAAATGHPLCACSGAAAGAPTRRVVLHLEPDPPGGAQSVLFPTATLANVLVALRQRLRDIDPQALVLNIATTPAAGVPWTAQ